MRTTEARPLPAVAALLAALLLHPALAPQAAAARAGKRLFAGAAAGYFYPLQSSLRAIYDRPVWPLELQLGWQARPRLGLFVAARSLQAEGRTVAGDGQKGGDSYALRLRILSLRLGAEFQAGEAAIAPFLGAGVQYAFFKEEWLGTPLPASSGGHAGFFALAGGRLRLARTLHLAAWLDYSWQPSGWGSRGQRVDLGGLSLALGMRVGIL
jgi:opacity protein-like surface antigen